MTVNVLCALCIYLYAVGALGSLAGAALVRVNGRSLTELEGPARLRCFGILALYAFLWPVMTPYAFATIRLRGDDDE